MSIARVLPATLAPRFKRARRAVLTAGDASFEAVVADRFALRLRGLAGLDEAAIVPLLFPRCRSLHTFGMRAPIDVAWLELEDGQGLVRSLEPAVAARRMIRARGGSNGRPWALELPAGDIQALSLRQGSRIEITQRG